jgi:hypothetical protein
MAATARAIVCELAPQKVAAASSVPAPPKKRDAGKVVLQPRLCTLRSYGAGSGVVTRRILAGEEEGNGATDSGGGSPFFASLADYIESSRKSQDFETISGRLAMVSDETPLLLPSLSLFRRGSLLVHVLGCMV